MKQLMPFIKSYRWKIVLCIALVFVQALSQLYLPTLMADIVDIGVVKGNTPYIIRVGVFMMLVAAAGTGSMILGSYLTSRISTGFSRSLRTAVFSHIETFSLNEFDQIGTSSLITRTTNDINQIQQLIVMMLLMFVRAPLMSIGGVVLAFTKDALLALILVASIPILFALIYFVQKHGVPYFQKLQVKLDGLNRVLRESLTGIRVVRAFGRNHHEMERFDETSRDLMKTSLKANRTMGLLFPGLSLILNLAIVAIMWAGSFRIDAGHLQVGDLMAFIQYAMQMMFALMMVSMMFVMIPRAQVSANRIGEVLQLTTGILETGSHRETKEKGTLEFREVTFRYPGAEKPALENVSFTAGPGQVTAIIGGTGSGKSTLLNLIPRFYEIESGRLLVDGLDHHAFLQEELRDKLGLVPQKAILFSGTIADNIRFGKPDATDEEVRYAAEIAQAAEFVEALPDGYDSLLNQGGVNLSGGQKQRLAIARALVRKPEIYLFDDSFSALDFKTDARLRQALRRETEEATVLIVAQRVNTIMDADQIIVLEDGRMVGKGSHEELIKSSPVYREIVASQLSEEALG
ncbi:ABC transporter ATP-binding protein [Pullulanibacillus sp. KACC 23026]|uniref:ABC transporter ATP-binding protein n=1 Tax=Pullulanibacillus sp. KACC 23026 TaxID=3028315 RepID=UPI0023B066F8|nr:ABC transporter ATP-binding protein [Pullulanibacillus sp. KACC 23026]WEG12570.1 ABC transporter ATP-binding protein [Pullulanibacillus sp. KACC 23026]